MVHHMHKKTQLNYKKLQEFKPKKHKAKPNKNYAKKTCTMQKTYNNETYVV